MPSDARSSSSPDGAASTRRLVAIVHADVVGYSRLIGRHDAGTCARLGRVRAGLIDPALAGHPVVITTARANPTVPGAS